MAIKGLTTKSPTATLTALVASEIRAQMGREMMSGRALARKLGTTQNWVATRVKGEVPIDLNDLQRIAEALNVPWRDLLPDTSAERPNTVTSGYRNLPESMTIPAQRQPRTFGGVSPQPFGGESTRTRPLVDIGQMAEPCRKVDVSSDRLIPFDPFPPAI